MVEEVAIPKGVSEPVEQIDDTVRRTDVDVERIGGTERSAGERGAMFNDDTDGKRGR